MLRKANVDTWQISKDANGKRLRDAAYVIPPKASESESESDSDPDDNIPLAKMIKIHRQERETSEDEDDIPLMELRKRLNYRELRQNKKEDIKVKDMEYDDEVSSDNSCTLPLSDLSSSEQEMDVNVVHSPQRHAPKIVEQEKPVRRKSKSRKQGDVKQLLRLISDML